jgi:glutamate mutase epsilon subunit
LVGSRQKKSPEDTNIPFDKPFWVSGKMAALDEDSIDEILYLARANEVTELDSFLSQVSAQTKQTKADILSAAVDQYSKNSALHYAAANGHSGMKSSSSCSLM